MFLLELKEEDSPLEIEKSITYQWMYDEYWIIKCNNNFTNIKCSTETFIKPIKPEKCGICEKSIWEYKFQVGLETKSK